MADKPNPSVRLKKDGSIDRRSLRRGDRQQFNVYLSPAAADYLRERGNELGVAHGIVVEQLIDAHESPLCGAQRAIEAAVQEVCQRTGREPGVVLREMVQEYALRRGLELRSLRKDEDPA